MNPDIQTFDPFTATEEQWACYQAYRRARGLEDFPDVPLLSDEEFVNELRRQLPFVVNHRLMALVDGAIVGNLILGVRREGTPDYDRYAQHVDVWGGVLRPHRRQGIGRALLATLYDFMRLRAKTIASMKVHTPEGHAFMTAAGATPGLRSVANRMTMAGLDWDELARWRAHVSLAHPGLRWEIHAPRAPMERLAQLMPDFSKLLNEQPLGDLNVPPMRYEMKAHEAWYAEMDRRGGEHYLVLLCAGETLVAMCDAYWDSRFPDRVFQQLTAVAAPWRGKGLAKAVKAAMLQLVRERQPEVTTLATTNAAVNAPMLSINRRLGFVVQREECTYQMRLEAIAASVSALP